MEQSPPLGQRPRLLLQSKALSSRLSPFEVITLVAILVIGAFIGYTLYSRSTDLNAAPEAAPTFLPAFRTTLSSTVSATGSVQASQQVTLTFGSTGKIKEFLVGLGQQVTAGQPLARIDDADLQQALKSAESSLASSEARFAAAVNPSQTDITSAQQSVASARAGVTNAENNLNDLKAKPTPAEVTAGQQSVLSAQNSLQSANDAVIKSQKDVLDAQNGVTTARNGVTTAQNALTTARNAVSTAQNSVSQARSDLSTARTNMNTERSELSIERGYLQQASNNCDGGYSVPSVPSNGDTARIAPSLSVNFRCDNDPAVGSGTPTPTATCTGTSSTPCKDALASAITKYNSQAGSYNSAVLTVNTRENSVTTAENSVTNAENGVTTAENNVKKAEQDVTTAQNSVITAQNTLTNGSLERSIQNAQLGLSKSQQDYQDTLAGAKPAEIAASERSLDSANASLASAQARFDALLAPPKPDVMLPLQATVDEARSNVEEARKNLSGATIIAPFEGQISQVTGEVGAQVSATTAVFILLNPRLIRIDANVDQAFISTLRTNQPATLTFDALAGRNYQSTVSAIGLTPTSQQGVVSYVVTFGLDTGSLPANTPIPSPGMSAQIRVTTTRTDNALVVPSRAVRRIGQNQTVTVKKADGTTEQRTVTTGTTNGTLIQITGGLDDGDEVQVTVATAAASTTGQRTTTGGTGGTGGGGGGGGQFFQGGGGAGGGGQGR